MGGDNIIIATFYDSACNFFGRGKLLCGSLCLKECKYKLSVHAHNASGAGPHSLKKIGERS